MAGVREVTQHSHRMASSNAQICLMMAYPDDLLWSLETRATTPRGAKAFTLLQPSSELILTTTLPGAPWDCTGLREAG